ncbi:MAG: twitching motility protein PilT [Candidatus Tectimicrobiota bacterium]|nr:MAG: twitching motility protein PilT [Candidatus Tectomicrobia bacterium]
MGVLATLVQQALTQFPTTSDLNCTPGRPLQAEVDGELRPVGGPVLTPWHTERLALEVLGQDRRAWRQLLETGAADVAYSVSGVGRLRVNVFWSRGALALVLRRLATRVPTLAELGLPPVLAEVAREPNGLVLVTGATGSGKSSTLAAILHEVNRTRAVHVVTLEDPIEFLHPHERATFNQRELGRDFPSFAEGLRAALRQAPKIILVGEMRDRETVDIALHAAETGHLVLSTLHTIDAGQSIQRLLGMVSAEEATLLRTRLAALLRWVISQRLVPKVGGGRLAVVEILRTSLRVQEAILHGEREGATFYDILSAGHAAGMQTFDQALLAAYEKGLISETTALAYASQRAVVRRGIDQRKSARGERTTDLEGLTLDTEYERRILGRP